MTTELASAARALLQSLATGPLGDQPTLALKTLLESPEIQALSDAADAQPGPYAYRRRSGRATAVQWTGDMESVHQAFGREFAIVGGALQVSTIVGTASCALGQWLVSPNQGSYLVFSDEDFGRTYER